MEGKEGNDSPFIEIYQSLDVSDAYSLPNLLMLAIGLWLRNYPLSLLFKGVIFPLYWRCKL